jgi:hypothetical protein
MNAQRWKLAEHQHNNNFTLENKIYKIYQYFNLKRSFELLKIKFQGG